MAPDPVTSDSEHLEKYVDKGTVEIAPEGIDRTLSQDVAALTGRSRDAARAALDVLGDNREEAYKMLMSNLVLTVADGLPCEIETLCSGAAAWLDGGGASPAPRVIVAAEGAFSDWHLLRVQRCRQEELQIFALEPVEICLLSRDASCRYTSIPLAPGWDPRAISEPSGLPGVSLSSEGWTSVSLHSRLFDPGMVVVPLQGSEMVPLVRVLKKPNHSVRPPCNTEVATRKAQDMGEATEMCHTEALLAIPEEDDGELEEIATNEAVAPITNEQEDLQKLAARSNVATKDDDVVARARPREEVVAEAEASATHDSRRLRRRVRTPTQPKVHYKLLNKVGSGAFGTVYLAEGLNQLKVAVKVVKPDSGMDMREVSLLKKLHHSCIVSLLDSYIASGPDSRRSVHLVMDFMPSSLHQRIHGRPLPLLDMLCYAFQLFRALAHLDGLKKKITHRDLKPENILVDGLALKLADFGSAKELGGGPSTSYICSRWWRAPELVLGSSDYDNSVDWWSCGTCIAEMMLGESLLKGGSCWDQMYKIIAALGTPSIEQVHALKPGRGCQRLKESVEKLVDAHRPAASWAKLLPAYSDQPHALDLVASLLVYSPDARLHPGKALSHSAFMGLPIGDSASEQADKNVCRVLLSGFSDEELSHCTEQARDQFQHLSRRFESSLAQRVTGDAMAGASCTRARAESPRPANGRGSPPLKRSRTAAPAAALELPPQFGGSAPLSEDVALAMKAPTGTPEVPMDVDFEQATLP